MEGNGQIVQHQMPYVEPKLGLLDNVLEEDGEVGCPEPRAIAAHISPRLLV